MVPISHRVQQHMSSTSLLPGVEEDIVSSSTSLLPGVEELL